MVIRFTFRLHLNSVLKNKNFLFRRLIQTIFCVTLHALIRLQRNKDVVKVETHLIEKRKHLTLFLISKNQICTKVYFQITTNPDYDKLGRPRAACYDRV